MNRIFWNEKLTTFLFFGLVFLLYVLFPSHNNSGDAWGMAADIKYGHDLFSPHHLLYSISFYLLKPFIGYSDILKLTLAVNGIIAFFILIILFYILSLLTENKTRIILITSLAAFSFGFWRFATENETYIIPIFFSLLASYFYIRACVTTKFATYGILLSGLFATIACLYHQIHIFWFSGLFFGWLFSNKSGSKNAFLTGLIRGLIFGLCFIPAPLCYFWIISHYLHQSLSIYNILHFVFHDYYQGSAGNHVSGANFFFGFVNLFRTFYQVHGQIAGMVSNHKIWVLPGIIALILAFSGIYQMIKSLKTNVQKPKKPDLRNVILIHAIIFALQLLFAIYNIGNAEFMVMLPVLLAILLSRVRWIPDKSLVWIVTSLFIWNFSYGIYPNNHLHFNADEKVADFVIQNPDAKFMIAEPAIVYNQVYYKIGHWPANCLASPGYYRLHGSIADLEYKLDSISEKRVTLYEDVDGRPDVISRGFMIYGGSYFFENSIVEKATVFKTDAGDHVIYRVKKWKKSS